METKPAADYRRYLPADYRKRNVFVSTAKAGRHNVGSCWDGGSRSYYTLVRNGRSVHVTKDSSPFNRGLDTHIELQPGDVLVETGVNSGKTATAHITFIEATAPLGWDKVEGGPVEEMLASFK